jgi:prevent-host-death family protein
MDVTATELKNRLGRYLDMAETVPVIVQKSGRAKSVIISKEMYERLLQIEDAYWAQKAREAEEEGYLGESETERLLGMK